MILGLGSGKTLEIVVVVVAVSFFFCRMNFDRYDNFSLFIYVLSCLLLLLLLFFVGHAGWNSCLYLLEDVGKGDFAKHVVSH